MENNYMICLHLKCSDVLLFNREFRATNEKLSIFVWIYVSAWVYLAGCTDLKALRIREIFHFQEDVEELQNHLKEQQKTLVISNAGMYMYLISNCVYVPMGK